MSATHPTAADHHPAVIAERQTGNDERLLTEIHDVEHDRPTALNDLPHQAFRNNFLDGSANRRRRIGNRQTLRIAVVHPDHIGLGIDNHCPLA